MRHSFGPVGQSNAIAAAFSTSAEVFFWLDCFVAAQVASTLKESWLDHLPTDASNCAATSCRQSISCQWYTKSGQKGLVWALQVSDSYRNWGINGFPLLGRCKYGCLKLIHHGCYTVIRMLKVGGEQWRWDELTHSLAHKQVVAAKQIMFSGWTC